MASAAAAQFGRGVRLRLRRSAATRPASPTQTPSATASTSAAASTPARAREAGGQGWSHRLSRRRPQLLDPAVGADQDARQQGRRRQARLRHRAAHRRGAVPVPVPPHGGRRHRDVQRREVEALRDVPAQGRLPVGGRLLGQLRVGRSGSSEIGARAAAGGVSDSAICRRATRSFAAQFEVKELPQIPSIQSWRGNRGETSERGERQRRAALPRHLRRARQHHGADDAQHRHLRCVGARGRGSAVLLPVLAERLCGWDQRR